MMLTCFTSQNHSHTPAARSPSQRTAAGSERHSLRRSGGAATRMRGPGPAPLHPHPPIGAAGAYGGEPPLPSPGRVAAGYGGGRWARAAAGRPLERGGRAARSGESRAGAFSRRLRVWRPLVSFPPLPFPGLCGRTGKPPWEAGGGGGGGCPRRGDPRAGFGGPGLPGADGSCAGLAPRGGSAGAGSARAGAGFASALPWAEFVFPEVKKKRSEAPGYFM